MGIELMDVDILNKPYLMENVEEAKIFRNRSAELLKSFRGFDDKDYDAAPWLKLLDDMKAFEKELYHFEILIFFYSDMARAALNASLFEEATSYAKAGESICESLNDEEGVRSNQNVLCDIALTVLDYTLARYYFELVNLAPTIEDEKIFKNIKIMEEAGLTRSLDIKAVTKKPTSYKFVNSEEGRVESATRIIMGTMGVGRAQAKKYMKFRV